MEVIEIDISDIEPYEFNNRKHPTEQVERIAKSIKDFGFNQPILVDPSNMTVIAGHGRLLAAKSLGLSKVPCCYPSKELSEKDVKALRILDNKLQNDSMWDFENVGLELDWLEDNAFDLEAWGLDDLRLEIPEEEKEIEDDEFEETEQKAIYIKEGDLIELGPHRVLCGDIASAQIEKADLLLTDPPYGVNMDKGFGGSRGFGGSGKSIKSRSYEDDWDDIRPEKEVFDKILASAKASIIFGGNFFADFLPAGTHWIFWDKLQTMPTFGDGELAWTNISRKSIKKITVEYNGLIGKEKERFHPTQKPIKIMGEIIKEYGKDVQTINDPFLGSGTTLIAADQLDRICYGIEREPKYCQVIIDRWVKHCEKQEKPANIKINGEPFEWQDQKSS